MLYFGPFGSAAGGRSSESSDPHLPAKLGVADTGSLKAIGHLDSCPVAVIHGAILPLEREDFVCGEMAIVNVLRHDCVLVRRW